MKGKRMGKRRSTGARADANATRSVTDAGWEIIRVRENGDGRFVAQKKVYEREDESVTKLFESDYTLEGLARAVQRREREEGFKS